MLWYLRQKIGDFIKDPRGVCRAARAERLGRELDLSGDRDIEWTWVAAHIPGGPGQCLDIGPGGGSHLGLAARMRGYHVTVVDMEPAPRGYEQPDTTFLYGDILKQDLARDQFDLMLNCSVVEHIGLQGSYGNRGLEVGDLRAMGLLRSWLKTDGVHIITLPVGMDGAFPPLHRVYGQERLPRILDGWTVLEEAYWTKSTADKKWHQVSQATALATESMRSLYGLGLFVLTKAPAKSDGGSQC